MELKNLIKELGAFKTLTKIPNTGQGYILYFENGNLLYSYDTIIAIKLNNQTYINNNYYDYSTTTGKHRNFYLGEKLKDTEKKIKVGDYKLF